LNQISQPTESSWAQRNGFAPWLMAVIWIISALILFQVVAGIVAIAIAIIQHPGGLDSFNPSIITENLDVLFIGNSFGQIVFLGYGTWLFAKTSARHNRAREVFKLQWLEGTGKFILLAIGLIVVIQPVIMFLSWINLQFPFPDKLLAFEEAQDQLLQNYLTGPNFLPLVLFHVAVVPAICEEIMYRGYIQTMFRRSMPVWAALALTGIIFGLYHVRMTQVIPLSVIGILLAYLTYASKSLYPAIAAHFVNNAGSVVAAFYYPDVMFSTEATEVMPPWELLIPGFILTGILLFWLKKLSQNSGGHYVQE
jgi:membrane protease YdiL (CAAX protease family)